MAEIAHNLTLKKIRERQKFFDAAVILMDVLLVDGCTPEEVRMLASPECAALRMTLIINIRSRIENTVAAAANLSFGS